MTQCLRCKHELPNIQPGDDLLCGRCSYPMRANEDGSVRLLTFPEYIEYLDKHPEAMDKVAQKMCGAIVGMVLMGAVLRSIAHSVGDEAKPTAPPADKPYSLN